MMPNLGQGGCQAIEDAYVLAEELSAATDAIASGAGRDEAVAEALRRYYRRRIGRTAAVQFLSRLASDLIINFFDTPWSPHDNVGKDWKSYLTFFWKPVLQLLIFPAQFAFLYSFNPSGPLGSMPGDLDRTWRERHRRKAEAAFAEARQAENGAPGRPATSAVQTPRPSFLAER